MRGIAMIPTREKTIENITLLSEQGYKKVATYIQGILQEDTTATEAEVDILMSKFNKKYENTFRALAQ